MGTPNAGTGRWLGREQEQGRTLRGRRTNSWGRSATSITSDQRRHQFNSVSRQNYQRRNMNFFQEDRLSGEWEVWSWARCSSRPLWNNIFSTLHKNNFILPTQPNLYLKSIYLPSEGEGHQHQWAEHCSERPERKVSAAKLSSNVRSSLYCDLPPSVHNFVHFNCCEVQLKNWQSACNSHRKQQTNKRNTMERPTSPDVLVVKVKDRRSTLNHDN